MQTLELKSILIIPLSGGVFRLNAMYESTADGKTSRRIAEISNLAPEADISTAILMNEVLRAISRAEQDAASAQAPASAQPEAPKAES